jgi:protoheme IX farnesyltransferase
VRGEFRNDVSFLFDQPLCAKKLWRYNFYSVGDYQFLPSLAIKEACDRLEKIMCAGWTNRWVDLLKLRISLLIALTGVTAAVLTARALPALPALMLLTLTLVLASAGAGALNHVLDVDIDVRMRRTRGRPLPAGEIRPWVVITVGLSLTVLALALATVSINSMVSLHLFLGWFVYVIVYTAWLKRRSVVNIVIGGLAGSFAALAGGASVRPELSFPSLLLAAILFLWTPPHFWALAITHVEDYRLSGVPMLPTVHGIAITTWWMLAHTILLVMISLIPVAMGASGLYCAAATGLGTYYLWRNIQVVREASRERAWSAFKASLFYLTTLLAVMIVDLRI